MQQILCGFVIGPNLQFESNSNRPAAPPLLVGICCSLQLSLTSLSVYQQFPDLLARDGLSDNMRVILSCNEASH